MSGTSTPLDRVMAHANVASYRSKSVDLNADGRPETLVYATDREHCGSGGCALFVVASESGRLRIVSRTLVAWPPIRLLESSTHGWRDLAVDVSGGGITEPYTARLSFDEEGYPLSAANPPAQPIDEATGEVLIAK